MTREQKICIFFAWFLHTSLEVVVHTAATGRTESVFRRDTYI